MSLQALIIITIAVALLYVIPFAITERISAEWFLKVSQADPCFIGSVKAVLILDSNLYAYTIEDFLEARELTLFHNTGNNCVERFSGWRQWRGSLGLSLTSVRRNIRSKVQANVLKVPDMSARI